MTEPPDWRTAAFEVYRLGRLEANQPADDADPELEFWIDELRESLLDLKEATIAADQARVLRHIAEVSGLLIEIKARRSGG